MFEKHTFDKNKNLNIESTNYTRSYLGLKPANNICRQFSSKYNYTILSKMDYVFLPCFEVISDYE